MEMIFLINTFFFGLRQLFNQNKKMSEDTIALLKKYSPGNKQKLREFLMTLYTP